MSVIKAFHHDLLDIFLDGDTSVRKELIDFCNDPVGLLGLSPMLDEVAKYLLLGISVVPQRPGAKSPCIRWKDYQTTQPTVAECFQWWHRDWLDAGIALILGSVSDLFVIDVDGEAAHDELVRRHGSIPTAPMVMSGSDNPYRYHLFFQHPSLTTKAKATPWHQHLEFRGQGGIVVAPPSLHKSGNQYRFAEGKSLDDLPLPPVPDAVLEALKSEAARRSERPAGFQVKHVKVPQLRHLSRNTREFLEGKYAVGPDWNARLFKAACDLSGNGFSQEEAEPMLLAGAQPWNSNEREAAVNTIRSAYAEPRQPAKPQTYITRPKMHPAIAIEFQRALENKKERGSKHYG